MITCTTILKVKEGKEEAFERLLNSLVANVLAHEPGTTLFQFVRSQTSPRKYLFIEEYADKDALEFHSKSEYLKTTVPEMLTYLDAEPELETFDTVSDTSSSQSDASLSQKAESEKADAAPAAAPSNKGAAMLVPTYFHIGVIVPNLEQAMADYSRILGLTFTEPAHVTVPRLEDPVPHEHHVYVAFSEDGPPYYELIEASGDGIFSAREQGKILYLGMWEADMEGRIKALKEQGIGLDAQFKTSEDSVPFCIVTKPDVLGIRLEYVSEASREGIERWVHTGKFEGGVG